MFYIDQLRNLSFPIGLVKTESGFIVRSAEVGSRRWVLVVAVISVDAYPFFDFFRPDLSPWVYGNRFSLFALFLPDSKETKIGSRDQEASPSAGKNTRVVLVPCSCMEVGEGRTSFCTGLISRKFYRFLLMFSTGFTSLTVLLLFPLSITFFVFVHGFWFCFIT